MGGFKNIVRFLAKTKYSGFMGCAASHLECINMFKPPFIIVEDDCSFTVNNFNPIIEIPDDTDILYLGFSVNSAHPYHHYDIDGGFKVYQEDENLFRILDMLGTHAIACISDKGVEIRKNTNIKAFIKRELLDIHLARCLYMCKAYGFKIPLFYQDSKFGGDEIPTKIMLHQTISSEEKDRLINQEPTDFSSLPDYESIIKEL